VKRAIIEEEFVAKESIAGFAGTSNAETSVERACIGGHSVAEKSIAIPSDASAGVAEPSVAEAPAAGHSTVARPPLAL
jgi:hypothetical protein